MEGLGHLSIGVASLLCLVLAFVSAVLPWVNAEVLVLSLPSVVDSRAELAALVLVATAGQMAGKCLVYYTGRRGGNLSSGRTAALLNRWRARVSATPWSPVAWVALSSTVGVPPFYVMSAMAGALGMNVGWFLAAGTCGRLVRFGVLACVPRALGFGLWALGSGLWAWALGFRLWAIGPGL